MQVMHDEEMPMADAQPLEGGGERGHVASDGGRLSAREFQRVLDGDLSGATAAPMHIAAPVHDRPVEPGVELAPVAKLRKLTPGREERFLDDVVGVSLAAEDGGGCAEGSVQPSRNQRLEGVNVATGGPLDEILVADSHYANALRHFHTIETTANGPALGGVRKE